MVGGMKMVEEGRWITRKYPGLYMASPSASAGFDRCR
jgi:hypothetical protein